jgi:hypothetical protein
VPPTAPVSTSCPDADTLAAYLDQSLAEEERKAVEAHLDGCRDCYTVFADTVAVIGHLEEGRTSTTRRRVWTALSALAAAALVAVMIRPIWPGAPATGGVNPITELTGENTASLAWRAIPATRSAESAGSEETAAFTLGVHDADLEIALRTGDPTHARDRAQAAALLLGSRGTFYRDLLVRIDVPQEWPSLAQAVAAGTGRRQAGLGEGPWQQGRWLETARRAALARRTGFFRKQPVRDRLRELGLTAPLGHAQRLEKALDQLANTEPDPVAWESLISVLEELAHGPLPPQP